MILRVYSQIIGTCRRCGTTYGAANLALLNFRWGTDHGWGTGCAAGQSERELTGNLKIIDYDPTEILEVTP